MCCSATGAGGLERLHHCRVAHGTGNLERGPSVLHSEPHNQAHPHKIHALSEESAEGKNHTLAHSYAHTETCTQRLLVSTKDDEGERLERLRHKLPCGFHLTGVEVTRGSD